MRACVRAYVKMCVRARARAHLHVRVALAHTLMYLAVALCRSSLAYFIADSMASDTLMALRPQNCTCEPFLATGITAREIFVRFMYPSACLPASIDGA